MQRKFDSTPEEVIIFSSKNTIFAFTFKKAFSISKGVEDRPNRDYNILCINEK